MKKLIAFIMVCSVAFAIVACGGAKKDESATDTDSAAFEAPMPAPDTSISDTTGVN